MNDTKYTVGVVKPITTYKSVYVLGRSDPVEMVPRSYSSFSGMDIKVYLQTYGIDDKPQQLAECQSVSYLHNFATIYHKESVEGTLSFVLLDKETWEQYRGMSGVTIYLKATNERGVTAEMDIPDVTFISESSGVFVDTIVVEHRLNFVGKTLNCWKPVKNESIT